MALKLSRHYIVIYLPIAFIYPVNCLPYQTQFIFTTELLNTIFINLNFRVRSYDSDRGGALFENKFADHEKKLTLNNLSSKYFAIVGDTSASLFKYPLVSK